MAATITDIQLEFFRKNSSPPNDTIDEAERAYWGPKQTSFTPWQNYSLDDVKLAGLQQACGTTFGSINDLERQWILQSVGMDPNTPGSINDFWQYLGDIPATNQVLSDAIVLFDPRKESQTATKTTFTNFGTGGSALNTQFGSIVGADTNDPTWLSHTGEDYAYIPKGNNLYYTSHTPGMEATTEFDIRLKVRRRDWTTSTANDMLVSKDAGGKRSIVIFRAGTAIWVAATSTGSDQLTGAINCTSLPLNTPIWVRVTWTAASGTMTFYNSLDGINWTSMGTSPVALPSIYIDSTTNFCIGNDNPGSSAWGEPIYAMEFRKVVDGPVTCSWRASNMTQAGGSSPTGENWTCVREAASGAKTVLVTRPMCHLAVDDYLTILNNPLIQFGANQPFTMVLAERVWGTQPGWNMYAGTRQWNSGAGWWIGNAALGTRQLSLACSDGTLFTGSGTINPADGQFATVICSRAADGTMKTGFNGPANESGPVKVPGSIANALDTRIGATNGGAIITNMEFYGWAVWNRVLSDEEMRLITNYFSTDSSPIDTLRAESLVWLDARTFATGMNTLTNQGSVGSVADENLGSTLTADTNDPTFISYDGVPAVYLPGVAGNIISAPSSPSLDFVATEGIEIIVDFQPVGSWSVARRPVARWGVGTSTWYIADTTQSSFVWWDGTGVRTLQTVSFFNNTTNFPNGSRQRLRYRALLNSGGTAVFGVDQWVAGAWVARPTINGAVSSLVPSTSPITIGTDSGNAQVTGGEGKYYEVIIKRGFDGPAIAYWKADGSTQTGSTDSMGNVWTIVRASTGKKSVLVTRPLFLFATDDFMTTLTDIDALDMPIGQDFTILQTMRIWNQPAALQVYMGKNTSPDVQDGYNLLCNGDVNLWFTFDTPQVSLPVMGTLVTTFGRRKGDAHSVGNGTSIVNLTRAAKNYSNDKWLIIGARGFKDQYFATMEYFGTMIFKRALTDQEINLIANYMGA